MIFFDKFTFWLAQKCFITWSLSSFEADKSAFSSWYLFLPCHSPYSLVSISLFKLHFSLVKNVQVVRHRLHFGLFRGPQGHRRPEPRRGRVVERENFVRHARQLRGRLQQRGDHPRNPGRDNDDLGAVGSAVF